MEMLTFFQFMLEVVYLQQDRGTQMSHPAALCPADHPVQSSMGLWSCLDLPSVTRSNM